MTKTSKSRKGITLATLANFIASPATDATDATDTATVDVSVATDTPAQLRLDAIVANDAVATDPQLNATEGDTTTDTVAGDTTTEGDTTTDEPLTVAQHRSNLVIAVNTLIANMTDPSTHWSRHRRTLNNIWVPTRPSGEGETCWYFFEFMFNAGVFDTPALIATGSTQYGLNAGQIRTEVSRYRKYHGIATTIGRGKPVTVATV
jgi:hypothetical protein